MSLRSTLWWIPSQEPGDGPMHDKYVLSKYVLSWGIGA
jgi:hypothetical protein